MKKYTGFKNLKNGKDNSRVRLFHFNWNRDEAVLREEDFCSIPKLGHGLCVHGWTTAQFFSQTLSFPWSPSPPLCQIWTLSGFFQSFTVRSQIHGYLPLKAKPNKRYQGMNHDRTPVCHWILGSGCCWWKAVGHRAGKQRWWGGVQRGFFFFLHANKDEDFPQII